MDLQTAVSSEGRESRPFLFARIIEVIPSANGTRLRVDLLNGSAGSEIQAVGSFYIPDRTVMIAVDGLLMTAVGMVDGPTRQATLTVVSSTSTTVTGVVNGESLSVPKLGTFTVSSGAVVPLLWGDDGRVWAGGLPGEPTLPPNPGGGGGGGGVQTFTTVVHPASTSSTGALYAVNAFKQFSGKTILSASVGLRVAANRTIRSLDGGTQVGSGTVTPTSTSITGSVLNGLIGASQPRLGIVGAFIDLGWAVTVRWRN